MHPALQRLQPYPFEKLAALKRGIDAPKDRPPILLSIGEPQHPTPAWLAEAQQRHAALLSRYPTTRGQPELRGAIAGWLERRFALPPAAIDPDRQVLPVAGTREALFAFAQAVIDPAGDTLVAMPNPFYQIYEGAALLAGAQPRYLDTTRESGYLPDFEAVPEAVWRRCRLVYVCTPGNPSGAVLPLERLQRLIDLSQRHGFVIASDECYSEIYADESAPPPGLLQAAFAMGNTGFQNCVVFHSLSKRSNAPGLRSGFVAGDARILAGFLAYRTYHGCSMPLPTQHASIAAWGDEEHVRENRALYRAKFRAVAEILDGCLEFELPPAGFYLWPRTPIADTDFARGLYASEHVTVLPGSFLSRHTETGNPGAGHVRIALVAPLQDCIEAAHRIRRFVQTL